MTELPRVEDATQDDLLMAIAVLGPLGQYGGFLRAVLGGIYAERERSKTDPGAGEPAPVTEEENP